MPPYSGVSQVMEVSGPAVGKAIPAEGESTKSSSAADEAECGWEAEYAAYLAEKEQSTTTTDEPNAAAAAADSEQKAQSSDEGESWEAQYQAYCIEKEKQLAEEDARIVAAMKEQANLVE